jgi:hypothetical protein
MALDRMAFDAALVVYNKECYDAEPFDNWAPPDNDYTAMVTAIKRGVKTDNGKPFVWWKIMVTASAPDHPDIDGKEFQLAFLSNKAFGQMKTVCNQLSQNTAKRNAQEYDAEMDEYIGTCINVRVHREKSEKTGKTYVNCDITEILEGRDVTPQDETASA